MRPNLVGSLVSTGCDWITVTCKDPDSIERCKEIAFSLLVSEESMGNFARPWFQSGYEGLQCGHVQWGEREDGCIVRLGSIVASAHWKRLFLAADNCTRLDLQATFRLEGSVKTALRRHYSQIHRHRKLFKRAPRLRRVEDDDGGYTIYSGRRCSDVFGRAYDKGAESGEKQWENCARYEVQYNGERARRVAYSIVARSAELVDLAANVLQFFQHRGAVLRSLLDSLKSQVILMTSTCRAKATDAARVLRWLRHSVSPSVSRLVHHDFLQEVLFSLRLTNLSRADLVLHSP